MTFQDQIKQGIPIELPSIKVYNSDINHAPKRKDILSKAEKELAIRNALRYFDKKNHPFSDGTMVVASVEEHSPAEPEDLGSGFAVSQAFSSTSSLKKSLSRLAQKRMNGVKCLSPGPQTNHHGKMSYRTWLQRKYHLWP